MIRHESTPDPAEHRVMIYHLSGPVDVQRALRLRDQLDWIATGHDDAVLVDLSGVSMLDSAGVSVLLGAHRRMADRGRGRFAVAAPQDLVQRVLRITGAAGQLDVHPTVDEGTAALAVAA